MARYIFKSRSSMTLVVCVFSLILMTRCTTSTTQAQSTPVNPSAQPSENPSDQSKMSTTAGGSSELVKKAGEYVDMDQDCPEHLREYEQPDNRPSVEVGIKKDIRGRSMPKAYTKYRCKRP